MHKPHLIYRHSDTSSAVSIAGCIDRAKDYGLRPGQYEIKPTGYFDGNWQEYGLYVDDAAKLKFTKRWLRNIKAYSGHRALRPYKWVPKKELYYG